MPELVDVAVIGAGPYGLTVAACLPELRVTVHGEPMATWRARMPPDMLLRSAWHEMSLHAAGGRGTLDEWVGETGEPREEPLRVATFLRYAEWFRERHVGETRRAPVTAVEEAGDGTLVVRSEDGEEAARRVVVAVGITPFPYHPPAFASLAADARVGYAMERTSFDDLRGLRVGVVGAGQSALEGAGLAAAAGASVELLARSPVRWFADREPWTPRSRLARRVYDLAYPAVGYGPPLLNRVVLHPDTFARLPAGLRTRLTRRLLRPGGSPYLRQLVDGKVSVVENVTVAEAAPRPDGVLVRTSDGADRVYDRLLLGTGYRFAVERLGFLATSLRARIRVEGDWPVLDRAFRTTEPRVLLVGYPAEGRFGPLARFVLGTRFTGERLRQAFA